MKNVHTTKMGEPSLRILKVMIVQHLMDLYKGIIEVIAVGLVIRV